MPGSQVAVQPCSHNCNTFPYAWRSQAAQLDFLLCFLVAALVFAGWVSLCLPRHDSPDEW